MLWDVFPDHSRIGGAPLNVATKLAAFGHEVFMVSSVGRDRLGDQIINFLQARNIQADYVERTDELSTGKVLVMLDDQGKASYEIVHPVAWDAIGLTAHQLASIEPMDVLVFGSLACRDTRSRNTLDSLLTRAKFKVLDINLRAPHYQYDLLYDLMDRADFVKFNDDELVEISKELGIEGDFKEMARSLSRRFQLDSVCVTLGEDGAFLLHQQQFFEHPGFSVKVKDTVGAGDSFLATILNELLSGNDPKIALAKACAMGAIVASKEGGNPQISDLDLFNFMQQADN